MKYPLSKNEWKWFILGILTIMIMCGVGGGIMAWIFKDDSCIIIGAVLGLIFIWGKLIIPFLDRI